MSLSAALSFGSSEGAIKIMQSGEVEGQVERVEGIREIKQQVARPSAVAKPRRLGLAITQFAGCQLSLRATLAKSPFAVKCECVCRSAHLAKSKRVVDEHRNLT